MNGTTYRYYYAGGKLMRMTWGTNTIDFFYDASGLPYAMKYNGILHHQPPGRCDADCGRQPEHCHKLRL